METLEKKASRKERRAARISKAKWQKLHSENSDSIRQFTKPRSLDKPIIYSIVLCIVLSVGLFYFELHKEALAAFMTGSFLGTINSLVNKNRAKVPFIICLVLSFTLLLGILFPSL